MKLTIHIILFCCINAASIEYHKEFGKGETYQDAYNNALANLGKSIKVDVDSNSLIKRRNKKISFSEDIKTKSHVSLRGVEIFSTNERNGLYIIGVQIKKKSD